MKHPRLLISACLALLAGTTSAGDPDIVWNQSATLFDAAEVPAQYYGQSLALGREVLVVGAPRRAPAGAAFVYRWDGASWQQEAILEPPALEWGDFGRSVAVQEDRVFVGASQRGLVFVYERVGSAWTLADQLDPTGNDTENAFGWSVAVHGDTLVVGSPRAHAGVSRPGAAYVFRRFGTDWMQMAKLRASPNQQSARFGSSIDYDGSTLVVGAEKHDLPGAGECGAAFVFVENGSDWIQETRLTAPAPAVSDRLGISVAVDGDTVIAGAREDEHGNHGQEGSVSVFRRYPGGWSHEARLVADNPWARFFGQSVDLEGDVAAVGAPSTSAYGQAYLFVRDGTTWTQRALIKKPTGSQWDRRFGSAIVLDQQRLVVGAKEFAARDLITGVAFVYDLARDSAFCFGDEGPGACPCGNASALGSLEGCLHSSGRGMRIRGHGPASLAIDGLELEAWQLPATSDLGLFFCGTAESTIPFVANGRLCVGGDVRRFPAQVVVGNSAAIRRVVQIEGSWSYFQSGNSYVFQYWARESQPGPCGGGASTSPALRVTMGP